MDIAKDTNKKSQRIYFIDLMKENKKYIFGSMPWILLIVLLLALFYLWFQYSEIKNDPLKVVQSETTEIIKVVGEIIVLPSGELPKIATLSEEDLIKVSDQSFFTNAKVGDKLLVYSVSRKIILYRPEVHKIVEVANLDMTINNSSSTSSIK